jgi:hypothetical protein
MLTQTTINGEYDIIIMGGAPSSSFFVAKSGTAL